MNTLILRILFFPYYYCCYWTKQTWNGDTSCFVFSYYSLIELPRDKLAMCRHCKITFLLLSQQVFVPKFAKSKKWCFSTGHSGCGRYRPDTGLHVHFPSRCQPGQCTSTVGHRPVLTCPKCSEHVQHFPETQRSCCGGPFFLIVWCLDLGTRLPPRDWPCPRRGPSLPFFGRPEVCLWQWGTNVSWWERYLWDYSHYPASPREAASTRLQATQLLQQAVLQAECCCGD